LNLSLVLRGILLLIFSLEKIKKRRRKQNIPDKLAKIFRENIGFLFIMTDLNRSTLESEIKEDDRESNAEESEIEEEGSAD